MSFNNFMIINSGRAASRAFYLNFKKQNNFITISRYLLDEAITSFIEHDDLRLLKKCINDLKFQQSILNFPICIVIHGLRPRLKFPFNDKKNIKLLNILKTELNIEKVFIPVREPEELLLSEINRLLALAAGDWTFPLHLTGWKHQFDFKDLIGNTFTPMPERYEKLRDLLLNKIENYSVVSEKKISFFDKVQNIFCDIGSLRQTPKDLPHRSGQAENKLSDMARKIRIRSGKLFSIFTLFNDVFNDVYTFDYKLLITHPCELFNTISDCVGTTFQDESLADTKMNSIRNRFLINNSFFIKVFDVPIRFRLEIDGIIDICDDWELYSKLPHDFSDILAPIENDLKAKIVLGINSNYRDKLPAHCHHFFQKTRFAEEIANTVLLIFVSNYTLVKKIYTSDIYLQKLPESVFKIFMDENSSEYEKIENLPAQHQFKISR